MGALLPGSRSVFHPHALHVSRGTLRLADKLTEVSFHAFLVNLPDVRLAVMLHKFIRVPGHAVLVTFSGDAGVRVCDGSPGLFADWLVGIPCR